MPTRRYVSKKTDVCLKSMSLLMAITQMRKLNLSAGLVYQLPRTLGVQVFHDEIYSTSQLTKLRGGEIRRPASNFQLYC